MNIVGNIRENNKKNAAKQNTSTMFPRKCFELFSCLFDKKITDKAFYVLSFSYPKKTTFNLTVRIYFKFREKRRRCTCVNILFNSITNKSSLELINNLHFIEPLAYKTHKTFNQSKRQTRVGSHC